MNSFFPLYNTEQNIKVTLYRQICYFLRKTNLPIPVAERSKAWIRSRSPAKLASSNPAGGMDVCLFCVLSGRGVCDGPIPRPEESYRLWLCDCV